MVQAGQNKNLAKFSVSLKYCADNQSYQTRAVTMKLLDTLLFKTENYGLSTDFPFIKDSHNFPNTFSFNSEKLLGKHEESFLSMLSIKHFLKNITYEVTIKYITRNLQRSWIA